MHLRRVKNWQTRIAATRGRAWGEEGHRKKSLRPLQVSAEFRAGFPEREKIIFQCKIKEWKHNHIDNLHSRSKVWGGPKKQGAITKWRFEIFLMIKYQSKLGVSVSDRNVKYILHFGMSNRRHVEFKSNVGGLTAEKKQKNWFVHISAYLHSILDLFSSFGNISVSYRFLLGYSSGPSVRSSKIHSRWFWWWTGRRGSQGKSWSVYLFSFKSYRRWCVVGNWNREWCTRSGISYSASSRAANIYSY